MDRSYDILFLCTGNSARSILAEAIVNRDGGDRFRAWSAGSFPKGDVHPQAIALLDELGFSTAGLRSKSWDEFTAPGAPSFDFISLCATMLRASCAQFGQASRCARIGGLRIQLRRTSPFSQRRS